MADHDMTASEAAILLVLMAEAREVLNTELQALYGLDVRLKQRENLVGTGFLDSRPSGRTYALQLSDAGWLRMEKDLDLRLRGAGALSSALTALHARLRDRLVVRARCSSMAELFAAVDLRAPAKADLRPRIISAYDALAEHAAAWVNLRRLRPFFADVPRRDLDEALRSLGQQDDVNIAPESNRRLLTAADREAALLISGQENHLLAIGV
jgi:hypothetical protein